ncbi:MAG: amidohydrolase family protein, partial [Desulfovibrionaceae bacterium]|nr:amidohydrolase family protein [Desulfovibrionaceae bacterium]
MSGCQLAVRGATLPDGRGKGRRVDLLVARGKVLELAPAAGKTPAGEAEEIDASGLVLLPSLTDAHTHLREPRYEYKEDIASGLSAAAHGGFGNVMCMANTNPVNDSA